MTSSNRLLLVLIAATFIPIRGFAQQQESYTCNLNSYRSGDKVTLIGTMSQNPHALLIHLSGCSSPVLVEYPSTLLDREMEGISPIQKDDNFKEFERLLADRTKKQITANLFGRVDIAPPIPEGTKVVMGYLVDGSGKRVGTYGGFGHPIPYCAYRLVLQSVTSVSSN